MSKKCDKTSNEDKNLPFPYEIKDIGPELNTQILQLLLGETSKKFFQVGPTKCILPSSLAESVRHFYNFQLRPDDVFLLGYPRSGTTWTQELIWLLCNNLDYKAASEVLIDARYTQIELMTYIGEESFSRNIRESEGAKSALIGPNAEEINPDKRRFLKSHLPFELLPPNLLQSVHKVVYVARNPKDVIVSSYHFLKSNPLSALSGEFSDFWSLFKRDLVYFCPYWEHVKTAWNRRNASDNFMFLFYEDLNKDLRGTIEKVAKFFGKSYSSEQLDGLAEHLKFDNFKKNKSVDSYSMFKPGLIDQENVNNRFIRKGKIGGWKECFDEELEREADEWIAENLKDTDLKFPL